MPPREFKTEDVRHVAPIEFTLDGEKFRATGSPPTTVVAAVFGVAPNPNTGRRIYNASILIGAIEELVIERIWFDDDSPEGGTWVKVDDRERMRTLLSSDERRLSLATLADLVMWIIEETIGHPTDAPK